MSNQSQRHYQRCFISAPFGVELGSLPKLLGERGISWEWAKDEGGETQNVETGLENADFIIVVLNGTKADYRGIFDAGIAIGLHKPIFLIQTKSRVLPIDFRWFSNVKASLSNHDALSFHLDLFLAAPHVTPNSTVSVPWPPMHGLPLVPSKPRESKQHFASELERRVYQAVISAGGNAISEPRSTSDAKYRPDFLAWLGNLDADMLDPVVIEVKGHAAPNEAQRLEERLLGFMQTARVRMALVLTREPPPQRDQQLSPNVLWLTIDEFEKLTSSAQLGNYVRNARNRIAHGAR